MEDDYLIMLVLHTCLSWKHIAHFLNVKFEREFSGEECARRYEALELQAEVQAAYQIRTDCGLKQENGKDDWTPAMDRVLCVLGLRKANNRRGRGSYSWLRIEATLNEVFMSYSEAVILGVMPERVTTVRNAKARWYLLENQLVDGSTTIMQEVMQMSQSEVNAFFEKFDEYPLVYPESTLQR